MYCLLGLHLLLFIRTNQPDAYICRVKFSSCYPRRQESIKIINKTDLKTTLYMCNTVGDAALTNIKFKYFYDFMKCKCFDLSEY